MENVSARTNASWNAFFWYAEIQGGNFRGARKSYVDKCLLFQIVGWNICLARCNTTWENDLARWNLTWKIVWHVKIQRGFFLVCWNLTWNMFRRAKLLCWKGFGAPNPSADFFVARPYHFCYSIFVGTPTSYKLNRLLRTTPLWTFCLGRRNPAWEIVWHAEIWRGHVGHVFFWLAASRRRQFLTRRNATWKIVWHAQI